MINTAYKSSKLSAIIIADEHTNGPKAKQRAESHEQILLVQKFVKNQEETEMWYDAPDDLLEYPIDETR